MSSVRTSLAARHRRNLYQFWFVLVTAMFVSVRLNVILVRSLEDATRVPAVQYKPVPVDDFPRPLKIPRIIHHTFRGRGFLTRAQKAIMSTWANLNPNWEIMYHEDVDCLRLVETHYSSFLHLFKSFPKNVEQADFFRYLILYHYGGVYVDIDVECVVPLDQWLGSEVRLVIGMENEFRDNWEAMVRDYPRRRQYQQWAIMSSKGHPLFDLVLRRIEQHFQSETAASFGSVKLDLSNRATLERTGPALWTDVLLSYLDTTLRSWESADKSLHPGSDTHSTPFSDEVWILPRVSTAAFPNGGDSVDPRNSRVKLLHHFIGGWKTSVRTPGTKTAPLHRFDFSKDVAQPSAHGFPVTVLLSDVANDQQEYVGHKSITVFASPMQTSLGFDGYEEGASLSTWGTWQGSFSPGDPQGLSSLHMIYRKSLDQAGLQMLRFAEIGSATGLRALESAKLGVSSLSIPSSSTDVARIEFSSKLCGVEKYVSVVDATSDFENAVSILGQFTRREDVEMKVAIHFEGLFGIDVLGALSLSELADTVDFLTGIIFFETRPDLIAQLLSGVLKKYKVFHGGNICDQLNQQRKRSTNDGFIYRKLIKPFIWRSYIGPEPNVKKSSFFTEPWCEMGSSDEHVSEFSKAYFSDSKVSQHAMSDGEAFVFVSDKAKLSFDKKRETFLLSTRREEKPSRNL